MIAYDKLSQRCAIGLAILAGLIDAVGFLNLGGFFLSFMSGNSTRFAAGLVSDVPIATALLPLGIIALFVIGVMLGRYVRFHRPRSGSFWVLAFVTALLAIAAMLQQIVADAWAIPFMVFAMGAANNVFVREGEVAIGVTYMTGTLVKLGQRLTARLLGDPSSQWRPYLLLWLGLVGGAVLGAILYVRIGMAALWIATALATLLTLAARKLDATPPIRPR